MNTVRIQDYCVSFSSVTPISDLYVPQTDGEISDSIMQNWTTQAVECFEINSNCKKCSLAMGSYSFVCQMPKIVKSLLMTYGEPTKSSKTSQ